MGWTIKLGRIAGIPVRMHLTLLLLLGWFGLSQWLRAGSGAAVVTGVTFMLALFGCVLLHELGHALMARRYGIPTRDITLLPIGGLARLDRMPDEPRQELNVALAGPAVNAVLAAGLYAGLHLTGGWQPVAQLSVSSGAFAERLMLVNVSLVLFNLLPAFPMDGGRILRALLALQMDYARATQTAAGVGQAMAFGFGLMGLLGNPLLLLIAWFVWIGATQEMGAAQARRAMTGVLVERAMQTNFKALSGTDTLERVTGLLLDGAQQDFPVVWGDQVIGLLTRADLMLALARRDAKTRIADVMRREFGTANAGALLEPAFAQLGRQPCHTMPVLRDGRLVGLLTLENISAFLMIEAALKRQAQVPAPAAQPEQVAELGAP